MKRFAIRTIWLTAVCIYSCSSPYKQKQEVMFVDINKILMLLESNRVSLGSIDRNILLHALYMDAKIKKKIDGIDPQYFVGIDENEYLIAGKDNYVVTLSKTYDSIQQIVIDTNSDIYNFLSQKFGIVGGRREINEEVLILDNMAYVRFVHNTGSMSCVLQMTNDNKIVLTLIDLLQD